MLPLTPHQYTQPLKMELIQGSETSANYNLTPGKYPEETIQYSNHGESLKSRKCCLPKTYGECSLYHPTLYHGLRYTMCMIMSLEVCVNCTYTGCMLNLYPDTISIMRVCFILDLKIICSEEFCNMVSGNNKIIQNFGKEITLRT